MEELFPALIFFAIAIFSSISKSKQKQKSEAAKRARTQSTPPQRNPWAQMTAPAAAPARPASMASMLPPREAPSTEGSHAAMAPTVHVHEVFDCDDHDRQGSLNFTSMEGHDPCHEEQMEPRSTIPAATDDQPAGLQMDWSANSLVRAVVMQEILTRPSQRRSVR